jgi:L-fucose isomerase-like protein
MYTAAFDHLGLRRDFGPEVDQLDQYVLIKRLESLKASEVRPLIAKAKKQWNLGKAVREKDLRISLRMYLALKQLAKEHRWDAVNVKCQYELSKDYGYTPCVPLSLLGNDLPCSCEGDIPLITTQLLIYYLTGKITSYCDIHTVDENELLMGACGFAPFGLGTGRPKVDRTVTLYQGLANCTQYKEGRITIARLSYTRERKMQLHVATGQAQAPRDFREVGCLPYPGMDMVLDGDTEDFAQHIMSQHYAVVYGDITQDLEEFCNLVPVEIIRVKS